MFFFVPFALQAKNAYCNHRASFKPFLDMKNLPDIQEEKKLLIEAQQVDHRFRITKAETLAVAFLHGPSTNRADRDQQIDNILIDISAKNIPVENFMAPRSHAILIGCGSLLKTRHFIPASMRSPLFSLPISISSPVSSASKLFLTQATQKF